MAYKKNENTYYKNKEWLQKAYKELKYNQTIGKSIGVSGDTIEYWRKKHGIEKPINVPSATRKHFYNEDYFEKIDTEHKAYWLGFIMADGAITKTSKNDKNYNRLSICLKSEDVNHLEKFKNDIEASSLNFKYKIVSSKNHCSEICELRLNSIKIVKSLNKHNITANKTGKEIIPDIPSDLVIHFIRGYFDGDGCIYINHQGKYQYLNFSICSSSKTLIEQIDKYFKETLNVKCYIEERKNYSVPFFIIGSKKQEVVNKIMKNLYKNATIYLDRKYQKYIDFCSVKE